MNDQMKLAGFEPAIQSGAPPNSAGTGDSTPQAASNAKSRPHLHGQRHVIDKASECFPAAFRQLHNPPQRLFVIGDPAALEEGIAIIGARKATPYGIGCARRFAGIAARHGLTVISGGAYGCDAQAHRSALDNGGKTVVFFGGGCDTVYPAKNAALFQRAIDAGGAVVSEREWDVPPLPWMFRERNRLIAGLAKATLVVEAGVPSGTFSTADAALAANRDVLAIPGSITSPTSAGSNRLIAQGALPIIDDASFESALFLLYGVMVQEGPKTFEAPDDPLLAALNANPMRLEDMLAAGFADDEPSVNRLSKLTIHIAQLERSGLIARFPDGRYGPAAL